jgi:hypothetical protein
VVEALNPENKLPKLPKFKNERDVKILSEVFSASQIPDIKVLCG